MRYFLLVTLLLFGCARTPALPPAPSAERATPVIEKKKKVVRLEFAGEEIIGRTAEGQKIKWGGFSGLRFLGKSEDGRLRFLSLTDRGPNATEEERDETYRPFVLPEFNPKIVYLLADPAAGTFSLEKSVSLLRPDGKPITGLPQKRGGEVPVDLRGNTLPFDPYGMDPESIAITSSGSYWIGEEYSPSLSLFSAEGKLLEIMKPGQGLPKVFEQARMNRGFEGLALNEDKLYAILQSPLDNPRSPGQKNSKKSNLVRILEVDPLEKKTLGQYAMLMGPGKTGKIGDIAAAGPGEFFVIEQNGKEGKKNVKKVFRLKLAKASNLQLLPEKVAGPAGSLELLNPNALKAAGVIVAEKEEVCDLAALGVKESKTEGIDLVDGQTLALITDNDFGLAGDWDKTKGTVDMKAEKSALYLIDISR